MASEPEGQGDLTPVVMTRVRHMIMGAGPGEDLAPVFAMRPGGRAISARGKRRHGCPSQSRKVIESLDAKGKHASS